MSPCFFLVEDGASLFGEVALAPEVDELRAVVRFLRWEGGVGVDAEEVAVLGLVVMAGHLVVSIQVVKGIQVVDSSG